MVGVFLGLKSQATCLRRFAAKDSKNCAEQDCACPVFFVRFSAPEDMDTFEATF